MVARIVQWSFYTYVEVRPADNEHEVELARGAARAPLPVNRRVARNALWELVDETGDVTLQLHCGHLFCNPSVSGAESGERPRIRFRSRLRN